MFENQEKKEQQAQPMAEGVSEMRERGPKNFEHAVVALIKEGNELMEKNNGVESRDPKIYHTIEAHITHLDQRAEKIADAIDASPEQRKLMHLAIAWHDSIINTKDPDPDNIVGMVSRDRGAREGDQPKGLEGNEALSAKAMVEAIRRMDPDRKFITDEQEKKLVWAVDATYPGADLGPDFKGAIFKEDPLFEEMAKRKPELARAIQFLEEQRVMKGPHFYQPHLENALKNGERVPEEVLAMSLSDLGGAGMDDIEGFEREGNNEGKELYKNIRNPKNLLRLLSGDDIKDQEDREKASNALLGWLKSQAGFAAWQMIRSAKISYWLEKNGQYDAEQLRKLDELSGHYEENVRASVDRTKRMEIRLQEISPNRGDKEVFAAIAREIELIQNR